MAKPKTNLYIDGANVFYSQKALGWSIDYKKTIRFFKLKYDILQAKYYTGVKEGDIKMRSFLRHLDSVGIVPVTKPLKKIKSGKKLIYKSNFDVEMTMDLLLDRQSYDQCILFSGDSDFHALVKKLKDFGKTVIVCSSRKMIAWELKLSVDKYIFLDDLKKNIGR